VKTGQISIGAGVLALVALVPALARAEGGVAPCGGDGLEIVEIFAGDEACPTAQYVLLQAGSRPWVPPELEPTRRTRPTLVEVRDERSNPIAVFGKIGGPAAWDAGPDAYYLVGTRAAAALFRVAMDGDAEPVMLQGGGLALRCDWAVTDAVAYGGAGAIPAPGSGQALKRAPAGWLLGPPEPRNAAGLRGARGVCPAEPASPTPSAPAPGGEIAPPPRSRSCSCETGGGDASWAGASILLIALGLGVTRARAAGSFEKV